MDLKLLSVVIYVKESKCKRCKENTREEILEEFDGMCEECYMEVNGDPDGEEEYPDESFGD